MTSIFRRFCPMLLGVGLLSCLVVPESQASFYATTLGGGNLSAPRDNQNTDYTLGKGLAGNLGIGYVSSFFLGLELNGLYINRSFSTPSSDISMKWIQAPLLLRLWLGSSFSIGVGPYVAFANGNTYDSTSSSGPLSYPTTGLKTTDVGATGSVLINFFPLSPIGVIFEGRYSKSMSNAATLGAFYYQDIQVLGGFRLGSQK